MVINLRNIAYDMGLKKDLSTEIDSLAADETVEKELTELAERMGEAEQDPALAAMAKVVCAGGMRRIVALARELQGGNGILLEHGVARASADAEAIYSYEGTQDMNTLILGRYLTGISAFV